MMIYYVSKAVNDILLSYLKTSYQTYLDAISEESGVTLLPLTSVEIGGPSTMEKMHRKPYMIIEPVSEEIDDQLPGVVEAVIRYDILIEAEGGQEEKALTNVGLYKDALVSSVLSDDTLGGEVIHASVTSIEQFPGGSGQSKYILASLQITVGQGR